MSVRSLMLWYGTEVSFWKWVDTHGLESTLVGYTARGKTITYGLWRTASTNVFVWTTSLNDHRYGDPDSWKKNTQAKAFNLEPIEKRVYPKQPVLRVIK